MYINFKDRLAEYVMCRSVITLHIQLIIIILRHHILYNVKEESSTLLKIKEKINIII